MATIRDVAKQSGYSITTVSRVINQHGYVSAAAREKITASSGAVDLSGTG